MSDVKGKLLNHIYNYLTIINIWTYLLILISLWYNLST